MSTKPDKDPRIMVEDDRTGMDPVTLERAIYDHLFYTCAKDEHSATAHDLLTAVSHAVRDRLVHRWIRTQSSYYAHDVKRTHYLSAEYLLGRALANNLINLGMYENTRKVLARHNVDLADLLELEPDPGLGNGGLGRLAACFLDSMATLGLPAIGYGIRYEFGIFEQLIQDGWQIERRDPWLQIGSPWELPRLEYTIAVNFYGRVEQHVDERGRLCHDWVDTQQVLGIPYDLPIAGYGNNTVNTLRLWSARATRQFNLAVFNAGDFRRAVEEKTISEAISKVLYPADHTPEGKELRLRQQYFFVACSIHDIVRRYKKVHDNFDQFADKVAIQLNDTHPAISVAELMRVLVDVEKLPWEKAWELTVAATAYTNHTLLPEALERWPVPMFERLLPRHLQLIYEINQRTLRQVHIASPNDNALLQRVSIIEEGPEKQVRMAHLATIGSHSINGVAALHSELVKTKLLPDFARLYPNRFNNKTNGVTPRRWILQANPLLAAAISKRVGTNWPAQLDSVKILAGLDKDPAFIEEIRVIKQAAKERLARLVAKRCDVILDPQALFDVQVKRIHEYKRQLLNVLHAISRYLEIKRNPNCDLLPRAILFAGKAAPGYAVAKLHIKLINDVAAIINTDPAMKGRLAMAFIPNYSVSAAEIIIPGADLSEQISTAGMEASGTGNMKFAMNGALTIGTLDGANIEIREHVGHDNFFLFGLTEAEVSATKHQGYSPMEYIQASPKLKEALDYLDSGFFSPDDASRYHGLVKGLREHDPYLLCADFDDYLRAQAEVDLLYRQPNEWARKAVHNIAKMGFFSSDRSIREYADEIWGVRSLDIELPSKA
ncbi:MAG: glycogen/starch/alpha-glucan phosphorylase [Myxococcota bacterium]|jgi:starch phosphorylase|nr:glycogen/starch/alpha-glucan phosphorylase [Myxococcota bacterium]